MILDGFQMLPVGLYPGTCMCVYIYIYICMYAYVCVCMCMYVYVCVCMCRICVNIYICLCLNGVLMGLEPLVHICFYCLLILELNHWPDPSIVYCQPRILQVLTQTWSSQWNSWKVVVILPINMDGCSCQGHRVTANALGSCLLLLGDSTRLTTGLNFIALVTSTTKQNWSCCTRRWTWKCSFQMIITIESKHWL